MDDELGVVPVPDGAGALTAERRLRLAIGASTGAALSALAELYPRGMKALQALKLALGTLARIRALGEDALRARVRGHFPEAGELPGRPQLDDLLKEAVAEVDWDETGLDGPGYYSRSILDSGSGSATLIRHPRLREGSDPTPDVLAARAIEDKIVFAAEKGVFLALTVDPRRARDAEAELLRRFPREVVSVERLMLRAMRARAEERRIAWAKALLAVSGAGQL